MHKYITELYDKVAEFEQLEEVAGPTEKARALITRQIFEKFLSSDSNANKEITALEIGPASGYITKVLSESINTYPTCRLDIMDFSSGFIDNVKAKNYRVQNYYCENISVEAIRTKFIEKYDIVFFQEVLEHLVSPFTALANINSMLKSDGLLFITIPNGSYWRNLYAEIFRPKTLLADRRFLDTHISEMSTFGILKLVTMAGFDVFEIHYYCSGSKIIKPLLSSEIGLLLIKRESPSNRWVQLQNKIVDFYK
jgi:2-polyprenyl-3-methyl-5-hydroxy-6-metoxy-1,4-benzoquinol methylase